MLIHSSKCFLLAAALLIISSCTPHINKVHTKAEPGNFPGDPAITGNIPSHVGILKLISLNVAHGRKDATNQIFVSKDQIQQNLTEIANVISKQEADVVALQEADGPSRWSGNFDHVEFIANLASYPWYYRAVNAHSWIFNYGTAILSRWPVSETLAYNFKPGLSKGFDNPTVWVIVNWWLKHRYRTGLDVKQAAPYLWQ